jgi:hypothetical protein
VSKQIKPIKPLGFAIFKPFFNMGFPPYFINLIKMALIKKFNNPLQSQGLFQKSSKICSEEITREHNNFFWSSSYLILILSISLMISIISDSFCTIIYLISEGSNFKDGIFLNISFAEFLFFWVRIICFCQPKRKKFIVQLRYISPFTFIVETNFVSVFRCPIIRLYKATYPI